MREKLIPVVLIACAMLFTSIHVSAAEGAAGGRPVTGVIVGIDRANRAIMVTDPQSGTKYRVLIPRGQRITIAPTVSFGSTVDFERLIIGLQYRGVSVR